MSTFAVTVEKIEEIRKHQNADRLEIIKLVDIGYQMIVPKGQYSIGDLIVYFPLDARIPNSILNRMGMVGKLGGKEHDIVKTVKLRGQISQGFVADITVILEDQESDIWDRSIDKGYNLIPIGSDVTEILGVTKYEPLSVLTKSANLKPLPEHVAKYDIENAEHYGEIVKRLMMGTVYISEKVEGSHWACSLDCKTNEVHVYQRNYEIVPIEGKGTHTWWKCFIDGEFERKLHSIKRYLLKRSGHITIRGEIIGPGIQKNYYKLDSHQVLAFEIEVDGKPVNAEPFLTICTIFVIPSVPMLWLRKSVLDWIAIRIDNYNGITDLPEISTGYSQINMDKRREGIVIKPMVEMIEDGFGRVFIKQKSPIFLAEKK